MKKKSIAAIMLVSLIGAVSLSACNGGCAANKQGYFYLPDYAVALDDPIADEVDFNVSGSGHPAYSYIIKTDFKSLESIGSEGYGLAVKKDGSTALYDMKECKELFTGTSLKVHNISGSSVTYFEMRVSDPAYCSEFIGPDGRLLVDKFFKNPSSFSLTSQGKKYVKGRQAEVFVAAYPSDEENPDMKTEAYFAEYTDEKGNKTWEKASKEDISLSQYSAGDTLQLEKKEIFDSHAYPKCNLKGYTYTIENGYTDKVCGTYTFYGQDGNKTGTVTLYDNCIPVAFVGNYFYFYEYSPVREDATKHYNIELITSYGSVKYNYVLYRYNFVNGGDRAEEIATDYVVFADTGELADSDGFAGTELYNYKADSFDRFYAVAFKMQDKIAVIGEGVRTYKMVFDENMAICADLSSSAVDLSKPVYKLGDSRFLSGNTVVDESCRTVAALPAGKAYVWEEQQLLFCGNMLFADYNGKVIIPSLPSGHYEAYGASLYANSLVFNRQNPSGIEIGRLAGAGESETVGYSNGVIYKRITDGAVYKYEIYDLEGKKIGDVFGNGEAFNTLKISGRLVFTGKADGSPTVWIIV